MFFLGLDVGTTRCKAALFDEDGHLIAGASREYGYTSPQPGWAEQDPEEVWGLVQEAIREALQKTDRKPQALSVSAQGEAVIFLDGQGKPLRRAILGMDMRAKEEAQELKERFGAERLLAMSGVPVHPLTSAAKILWVKKHEPEVFRQSAKMLCYEDFILWKLGGIPAIDFSMACKTLLFDMHRREWSRELLEYLELDASRLATCFPSGTVVGTVRKEVAAELGLPTDLRLVAGGHDQCCAALGAGSTEERVAFDNAGTAEVFGIPVSDPSVVLRIHPQNFSCYAHVLPQRFLLATLNQTAGLFLRWYRDTFARQDSYEALVERASKEPSHIFALPHLVGSGTPWIDPFSKAAFVGMTLHTDEGEVIRAILEGVVFEQKMSLDLFEEQGVTFEEVRVTGGCARSPLWLQIRADIFGRPVKTLQCEDASVLGAAILAACGLGAYASPQEAAARMVKVKGVWEPNERFHRVYQEKLAIYRDLYFALRDVHHRMG